MSLPSHNIMTMRNTSKNHHTQKKTHDESIGVVDNATHVQTFIRRPDGSSVKHNQTDR